MSHKMPPLLRNHLWCDSYARAVQRVSHRARMQYISRLPLSERFWSMWRESILADSQQERHNVMFAQWVQEPQHRNPEAYVVRSLCDAAVPLLWVDGDYANTFIRSANEIPDNWHWKHHVQIAEHGVTVSSYSVLPPKVISREKMQELYFAGSHVQWVENKLAGRYDGQES